MTLDDLLAPPEGDDLAPASSLSMALHFTETGQPTESGPNIFEMLSERELARLVGQGRETSYRAGEYFFRQGDKHDGIHFIRSGRIRSFYLSPSGREITLAYWPRGHFVGAPQILGGGEHMWSSVAVEPSVGLWLPGAALRKLIYETPSLAIAVIEGLVYKSMCYTALLQIMGTQSKTSRLGHLLLTLSTPRTREPNVADVGTHFTQEELANMVGSTRQSISTSLDKFERQGLIERRGNEIRITDVAGLRALCD
jgi:CRP/FNR family transcriptional regulator, cyclic AMP receptor protein